MIYFKSFFILFLLFLYSCSSMEFVYNESYDFNNPLFNKTNVIFKGANNPSFYRYSSRYFGQNKEGVFELYIKINEEKTKRAVKTNQAISKLDYKLTYSYELFNNTNKCFVFKKTLTSRFSIEPKSSGYNFGSDQSLQRLYDLSIKNNFQQFISFINEINSKKCLNED